MRNSVFIWAILGLMLVLDFYVFQAVKTVTQNSSHKLKMLVHYGYWGISVAAVLVLVLIALTGFENWPHAIRNYVLVIILGLFFAKLLAAVFFLVDDIRRLAQWGGSKLLFKDGAGSSLDREGITRSVFMSWLGLGLGGGLFSSLVYGFTNKYNYQVHRLQLAFSNLPAPFKGLKIVQVSDIHSGSFTNKHAVNKGVDMILKEKADVILFTGDLVNDLAAEVKNYMDVFNRLKAPMGVYSTLGNHDYGDYYYGAHPTGERAEEKAKNLQRVKEIHGELGWKLLLDENIKLEKGGQHIALI
ncbi:MAG: metallophosphoesterase, partial [Bacteroidetes bacterium]|nr:metallophosphoesterase [Bacteroidota bacterium]